MAQSTVDKLKTGRTGWMRLDNILKAIEEGINARTPIAGLGIETEGSTNGTQISAKVTPSGDKDHINNPAGGGGSSGSIANVFGAVNGFPKVFHLFQSSPPTDP